MVSLIISYLRLKQIIQNHAIELLVADLPNKYEV